MLAKSFTLEAEVAGKARRWREENAEEYGKILLLAGEGGFRSAPASRVDIVEMLARSAERGRLRARAKAAVRASEYHRTAVRVRSRSTSLRRVAFCGLALGTTAMAVILYPYLAPASWSAPYLEQHRRTEAIVLEDRRERWVGVLDRSLTARARDSGSPFGLPPYVAMESESPEAFIQVLYALEDRHIGSWRSIHGIDVLGVVRGARSLIGGGTGPGGSSLAAQLVRSMDGSNPGAQSTWVKLRRKAHEFAIAPLLYHKLGGADSPAFRNYLGRHITLAIGAPGSRMGTPLHGVGLAGQVVFGRSPTELTKPQSAIFAAAVQAPIILAPGNSPGGVAARNSRWRRVQDRAILGLKLAYPHDPDLQANVAAVNAMPPPSGQADANGVYHPAVTAEAFKMWANPEVRALAYASGELRAAYGQLSDALSPAQMRRVNAIRLTLDTRENALFKAQLRAALETAQAKFGGTLNGLLTGANPAADIIATLVRDGEIVRYFANMQEPAFYGGWSERDAQGRYVVAKALRPIGSTGKVMLAPLLGQADSITTRYCNERHGRVQNAGGNRGGSCADSHMWYDARTVFAKSYNLPLIWRLRATPDAQLRALAQHYGLRIPGPGKASEAIVLGAATARPADMVRMIDALGRGAAGAPARAPMPTIVAAFRIQGEGWKRWQPSFQLLDISNEFEAPGARSFVRGVLGAPVEQGGTLAGIGPAIGAARDHIGKSGTSQATDPDRDRGKFAIGAFALSGSRYTYLLMMDGRDPARGLAGKLSWQPLYPLLQTIVRSPPPANPQISR